MISCRFLVRFILRKDIKYLLNLLRHINPLIKFLILPQLTIWKICEFRELLQTRVNLYTSNWSNDFKNNFLFPLIFKKRTCDSLFLLVVETLIILWIFFRFFSFSFQVFMLQIINIYIENNQHYANYRIFLINKKHLDRI